MGTVLTLTELTTNCVGNHSVIIMIKAVNKRYTVLRMRDAQQIFTQQMKTDLHDITGEYGTKCKFWLFSSLMVYHLTHTLKNLFLLIGKSGNQHMKFT